MGGLHHTAYAAGMVPYEAGAVADLGKGDADCVECRNFVGDAKRAG